MRIVVSLFVHLHFVLKERERGGEEDGERESKRGSRRGGGEKEEGEREREMSKRRNCKKRRGGNRPNAQFMRTPKFRAARRGGFGPRGLPSCIISRATRRARNNFEFRRSLHKREYYF